MKNNFSFVPQTGGGIPISEIALRILVEFLDRETYVIGTATLISGHLAITAGHVLDDILERFGSKISANGNRKISDYAIRLYQILPGPQYNVWQVFNAFKNTDTDLALLHFGVFKRSHNEVPITWHTPHVHFTHPPIGSKIFAFGYHSSTVKITAYSNGAYHLDLNDIPTISTGIVEEILPKGQPSGKFTFPCYRVAAKFEGGMSGGPVFDEAGFLSGVISGALFAGDDTDPPISYVCMLWPILRQLIPINRGDQYPRGVSYPLIHLVRDGLIHSAPRCFEGLPPQWITAWMTGVTSI